MSPSQASITKTHAEVTGFSLNGWLMLLVTCVLFVAALDRFRLIFESAQSSAGIIAGCLLALGALAGRGLTIIQPNESVVLLLFGAYRGTVRITGFRWCNPFARRVKISLRARNLVSDQLKVNDRRGNPIEITAVVVWRIADTAQALFDVENYEAEAVISARQKIVQGAVSMVEMALKELESRGVIDFDPERRAAMVSNLLVVLCGESETKPVINTGTLYH